MLSLALSDVISMLLMLLTLTKNLLSMSHTSTSLWRETGGGGGWRSCWGRFTVSISTNDKILQNIRSLTSITYSTKNPWQIKTISQVNKGYPHPALLIISLIIVQTGLSSFMHILSLYIATVFIRNRSSVKEVLCLQKIWTDRQMECFLYTLPNLFWVWIYYNKGSNKS